MYRIGFLALFTLIFLSACGQMVYSRPGGTTEHLRSDQYECKREWAQSAMGQQFARDPIQYASYGFSSRGKMQECMEHRGWKREQ